ncbi:GAK system XXXCH domain-containing protein [Humidesulfovibrio idahonensis]
MGAWKLEKNIAAADLPGLLRQLADALEGRPAGFLAGFPREPRELELEVLRGGAGYAVKLKARRDEDRAPDDESVGRRIEGKGGGAREADSAERGREKYRQLKKLMQADYKALQKAAQAGALPAPDVLESFLALCESMTETAQPLLSPHGPEAAELARANQVFMEDARALRRTASARDAAALAEVLARLERRKSACHAQFR